METTTRGAILIYWWMPCHAMPGATLLDLGGLQDELEELLGVRVDLLTPRDLPVKFRAQVLAEAIPV